MAPVSTGERAYSEGLGMPPKHLVMSDDYQPDHRNGASAALENGTEALDRRGRAIYPPIGHIKLAHTTVGKPGRDFRDPVWTQLAVCCRPVLSGNMIHF